jgi:hypothetical protein
MAKKPPADDGILDALQFVRGAIGKRGDDPALTHFHIHNRRVTGYNGRIALSAPIALDIDCTPRGDTFARAIAACGEAPQIMLTPTGKISIRAGTFRALVETLNGEYPHAAPEGVAHPVPAELLPTLATLYPLTDNPAHVWAQSVLFAGASAYATNNIIAAERYHGTPLPRFALPRVAVAELLRISETPTNIRIAENSATFYFSGDRWLFARLLDLNQWRNIAELIERVACSPNEAAPVPPGLFAALDKLAPFLDILERVTITPGTISTIDKDGSPGAAVDLPHGIARGCYNLKALQLLAPIADRIAFHSYPNPSPFFGAAVRGIIAGCHL